MTVDLPSSTTVTAAVLFILSLLTAHALTPYPLDNLGRRPNGYGLWTYLHSQLFSSNVGMWGFDSSLGSFSPIWRLSFHCSGILALCSLVQCINLLYVSYGDEELNKIKVLSVSTFLYSAGFWLNGKVSQEVSDPGGPREHKIRRKPEWSDSTTFLKDSLSDSKQVRCAVAKDSHQVTLKRFGLESKDGENGIKSDSIGLSGEPFGRQIWSIEEKDEIKVDDSKSRTLIEEMASAGRVGFNPSKNPNSADTVFREQMITQYVKEGGVLPNTNSSCKTVEEAAKKAVHFFSMLQTEDGHWAGDYGGPHFLMPGLIISWYVMGKPEKLLNNEQCQLMSHYLKVHQQADGGWGTHIESPSTMFGTVLSYVSLRLLGANPEEKFMIKAREFIHHEGGAIMTSSWAKFWLCLLGCMEWEGHNSVPPEMWLLPNWFPYHPGRMWCHCRMVYLPMGYLYGVRFVYENAETDNVIQCLRKELYCTEYDSINWTNTRHLVADMDNYSPIAPFMAITQNFLAIYENWAIFQPFKTMVRKWGLEFSKEYLAAEDLQTNYIDIGPVNKTLNMVSAFHAANKDIEDPNVQNHMMRVPDYLWVAEDGMKMQGYNGSQCWDTSFAIQAISEAHLVDTFPGLSKKVWAYLERTQILSTEISQSSPAFEYESTYHREKYYRHVSKGGWPFSTSAHGWPISDCTAEGLKGVLELMKSPIISKAIEDGELKDIDSTRLHDAVNVIITLQNEDGGWATYENNRGFRWYEKLNPSEVFGDIMIDYSYVECSMASLTALAAFHERYPTFRTDDIQHAIGKGKDFLKRIQREDGSWYGSWACCFCYGSWFGIEGLVRAGESVDSPAIQRCCRFLLSRQRDNGGWGEDFTSCYDKDYAENGMEDYGDSGSGVISTAWALLALSEAKCQDLDAIDRGVKYLIQRQLPSGDFPQEGISGVFNRACGITYTSYRNVFPIWALGRVKENYSEF